MSPQADWPLISIVTPTLNRAAMIGTAIESVLSQDYPNVEHIIVDAASTDGTGQVLARYPHLHVIVETDRGVYDGLNKGIRAARGEVIGHLNSDDAYLPGAFFAAAERFAQDPEIDVVSGGASVSIVAGDGKHQVIRRFDAPEDRQLGFASGTTGAPLVNARFFRRRVYQRLGLYDHTLRVAADRDFLIRAALAGLKTAAVDAVVYDYLSHPGSLTMSGDHVDYAQSYGELLRLAERYMDDRLVPPELRERCLALHRDVARSASVALLVAHQWRIFNSIFWRGVRSDRFWLLRFGSLLVRRGVPAIMRRMIRPAP
jgi:glycosyltransferase involved in cell wall biosynthesis